MSCGAGRFFKPHNPCLLSGALASAAALGRIATLPGGENAAVRGMNLAWLRTTCGRPVVTAKGAIVLQ